MLDKYEDIEAQYNEQVDTQNTAIKHDSGLTLNFLVKRETV